MPRIRRLNAARPGTLRLYTLQPVAVWHALERSGVLYVDETLIPGLDDSREAYDWLREQMARRIPGYGGRHPWWAYEHWLDLRRYRFHAGQPGERWVRLELAVRGEQVLLSAYGPWHSVLNRWYLPHAVEADAYEHESNAWDRELADQGVHRCCHPLPEPYEARMVASWERIFDVDDLRETNTIQATFERLALEDVVAVTEYTSAARGR